MMGEEMIVVVGKAIGAFGGGAFIGMEIIDSLRKSGNNVGVISLAYNIRNEYSEIFSKIPTFDMPHDPKKSSYKNGLLGMSKFWLKKAAYQYKSMVLRLRLDKSTPHIFILNDTYYGTIDILNIYNEKAKSIQIVHVSPGFVRSFFGEYSVEDSLADYNRADIVVFVSDVCRKEWLSFGVIDEKKTFYIPNCAKEDEALQCLRRSKEETRERLGLSEDSFLLVNVSSVQERKGQDLIVKAAPKLKEIAPDLEIIIVGSKGGEFASGLQKSVDLQGLDFITFEGRKSNAMEYIYASDMFVLPSRAEAFPLVILEAMILKTPVIASDADGTPEMIIDGETGRLFKSENINELVDAFSAMYKDHETRKEHARNASDKYWNEFSKDHFTGRYANLIRQVTNGEIA